MRHLILAGAGHAHALALLAYAKAPPPHTRVTLVTPANCALYSGMLPGVLAGHYEAEDAEVDFAALAVAAGAQFVAAEVVGLDAARRTALLSSGSELAYDELSLNVGSVVDTPIPGSVDEAVPVKPFREFLDKAGAYWEARIAIIGGGAAGTEIAMALRHRGNEVAVYSEESSFSPALGARVAAALRRSGVSFIALPAAQIEPGPLVRAGMSEARYDAVVLATGAAPARWLGSSGLQTDERGFVLVDRSMKSLSHPEVRAFGDCATVKDAPHPRSGLFAVRQAEAVLANRLFVPQAHYLSLISCGRKYAIAARGVMTAEGPLIWRWKDWIDRRWIARFRAGSKRN